MKAIRSEIPLDAIWHDVECGAYAADLPLWRRLGGEAAGSVLELGCGTGRVALHLAAAGFGVAAVDRDAALLAALRRRAEERGLDVRAKLADVRRFELGSAVALIIAPMQLVHLLGGRGGRQSMLACARRHLEPQGRVAIALLDADAAVSAGGQDLSPLSPDVRELDGWVYSSLPVEVIARDRAIEVRRLRQVVAPGGELSESVDATVLHRISPGELEREAGAAGLRQTERIPVPPTDEHVGSTVVVLEARAS